MQTNSRKQFSIYKFFLIFLTVSLIGALLLCLPISAKSGNWTGLLDNYFNAMSAICVTGLSVSSVTDYTIFGQTIILLLIQFGGLGLMTFATVVYYVFKKRISLGDRIAVQEFLGDTKDFGIKPLLYRIILVSFGIEAIGFLILLFSLVPKMGAYGVFASLFMSVSAFCNAGFNVLEGAVNYPSDILWLLSSMMLIVLGGLGFSVIIELIRKRRLRQLSLHSKIVLLSTSVLIITSAAFYMGVEWNNPSTLGSMPVYQRIFNSFFMAITTRTAGFSTVQIESLTPQSKVVTMFLMFIGASPASTGGGVKTTTLVIILFMVLSGLKGDNKPVIMGRQIRYTTAIRAVTVLTFFLAVAFSVVVSLLFTEAAIMTDGQFQSVDIIFESISALSTTGLSTGVTSYLSAAGKTIIMLCMLIGKLGPLTIGALLINAAGKNIKSKITYPDGNIIIG